MPKAMCASTCDARACFLKSWRKEEGVSGRLRTQSRRAAWGSMVNDGYRYLLTNPWLSFAPGIAIMLVVFAFNMVGDGLRDALDPRLRGQI